MLLQRSAKAHSTMRHQQRWFIIGTILFISVMILLGQLLQALGVQSTVALTATTTLITIALVVLASVITQNQRTRAIIQRMAAGEHWTHWHYPAGEWRNLAAHSAVRAYNTDPEATLPALGRSVILYTVSASAIGYLIGMLNNPPLQAVQVGLIMGSVVLVLSLLFAMHTYRRAHELPSDAAVDVYIGPLGICLPERHIALVDAYTSLTHASVQAGEPALLLLETRFSSVLSHAAPQKLVIPVPPGQEQEARILAERLQAKFVLH